MGQTTEIGSYCVVGFINRLYKYVHTYIIIIYNRASHKSNLSLKEILLCNNKIGIYFCCSGKFVGRFLIHAPILPTSTDTRIPISNTTNYFLRLKLQLILIKWQLYVTPKKFPDKGVFPFEKGVKKWFFSLISVLKSSEMYRYKNSNLKISYESNLTLIYLAMLFFRN